MDVYQFFLRKNIHILRALKNVENLPCYHGFFRTPLNTHKIRQILPTNSNRCLNSKSIFVLFCFDTEGGELSYKEILKSIYFYVAISS